MADPQNGTTRADPEALLHDFLVAVRRGLLMIVAVVDRAYPRPQPPDRCPRCDWRWR